MHASPILRSAVEHLFNRLSAKPSPPQCRKCSSKLMQVDTTFFSSGGKIWTVALPVCPRCDLKNDTARFIPSAPVSHVKLTLRGFSFSNAKESRSCSFVTDKGP